MRSVVSVHAPKPLGHYSQGTEQNGTVYVSAQLPLSATGAPVSPAAPVDVQTAQVLKNIEEILLAAGSSRDQVLRIVVYVTDMANWDLVNKVYEEFFGGHRPARSVISTTGLHLDYLVAMDAVAVTFGDRA